MFTKPYDKEPMHIFASVYIRAILHNVPEKDKTKVDRKLYKILDIAELKFYKHNPELYDRIMDISKDTWEQMKASRDYQVYLEPSLIAAGLYAECRETFKKRFKLKETLFDKMIAQQTTFSEHELTSYQVVKELLKHSEEKLKDTSWTPSQSLQSQLKKTEQ